MKKPTDHVTVSTQTARGIGRTAFRAGYLLSGAYKLARSLGLTDMHAVREGWSQERELAVLGEVAS